MSGICSAHQHHDPACPQCNVMTPLLSNMSPEDMRVAMALLDGRHLHRDYFGSNFWLNQEGRPEDLPDYLNSLDAVAPVEARLTDEEQAEYVKNLYFEMIREYRYKQGKRRSRHTDFDMLTRTALQRTKAILLATGKARL